MRAADIDLLQQGYRRGWLTWDRVRAALDRILPPCDVCGAPANAGGWAQGERLCADCAMERLGREGRHTPPATQQLSRPETSVAEDTTS